MHCISFLGAKREPRKVTASGLKYYIWSGLTASSSLQFCIHICKQSLFFFLTRPIIVGQSFTLGESWHIAVGLSQVLYVAESEGCTRWLKGWHPKNENHMFNWVLSICAQVRLTIVCGAYGNVWFCMPAICKSYILSYPILPINFSGEQTHSQLTTVVINE